MNATAETILLNARILTMDPEAPGAEAVALAGGRILAVGSTADIQALAGPATRIIDAGGNTLLPGFSESHMHLFSGAAELDHLQLGGVFGFEALAEKLKAYAAARPEEKILFGQGADYTIVSADEPLTRQHLDRILPDRAVAIFAYDHHTVWANTRALEAAGLLHGKTLPPGNEIVMAEDGTATGELREMEAFGPLLAISGFDRYRLGLATGGEPDPYPSRAEFEKDMEVMMRGLNYCARHGITSIQNMDGNLYQLQLLQALVDRDGALPCRVKIPFHYKPFMQPSDLEKASAMTRTFDSEWLSSGLVKMFHDGVLEGFTAVLIDDYADRPGHRGEPLFSAEAFDAAVVEADRRGLQVAVHSIGDGAVRDVLDAYQKAAETNGRRDSRHRVEHVEMVHPDDIDRFAELGVIASMQPPHPPGAMGLPLEPTVSRIGRHRWRYSYAWRTLKDAGARIPFSSDWPVSPIDPLHGIEAAVTRKPWGPEDIDHSLTLPETLAAYTVEGAYAEFNEDSKGRIKPGFYADLVLLDGDIEAVSPDRIHALRPKMTICGGTVTYTASPGADAPAA